MRQIRLLIAFVDLLSTPIARSLPLPSSLLKTFDNRMWRSIFWLMRWRSSFSVSTMCFWYFIPNTCRQFCSFPPCQFRDYKPVHRVRRRAAYQYNTWSKVSAVLEFLIPCVTHSHDAEALNYFLLLMSAYLLPNWSRSWRQRKSTPREDNSSWKWVQNLTQEAELSAEVGTS